ncbi:hypothetical protein ymoll0001_17910 [Yersinia mollaretii ATCC 43969]|uniref:Uncharacterized protein n=1 Tax=Yersinia mollaretii (strain ATCC 43969 / DSM 18520 / CIP 103324 / CNY 7263 / WAIP 204) TaxID=349967 RepID=A0ABM9Y7L5_YERMW|nr:hypothetical protein ymoll0001_17910 [Yersinia mollaretii ATCC 43969]
MFHFSVIVVLFLLIPVNYWCYQAVNLPRMLKYSIDSYN